MGKFQVECISQSSGCDAIPIETSITQWYPSEMWGCSYTCSIPWDTHQGY